MSTATKVERWGYPQGVVRGVVVMGVELTRRNLNGTIADRLAFLGIEAEFRYTEGDTPGNARMLWHLSDGRVLTPGEMVSLLGLPEGTGFATRASMS